MDFTGRTLDNAHTYEVLFGAIERENPVESIVERLSTAIGLGLLADGEMLPSEPRMAAQLGVTVFSLREALSELRARGLVETRRGRNGGSTVRRPSDTESHVVLNRLAMMSSVELRDLCEWRQMLSGAAAMHAAQRASSSNVRRLRGFLARIGVDGNAQDVRVAYSRFHLELAAAAQSVRLSTAEVKLQGEHGWVFGLMLADDHQRDSLAHRLGLLVNAVERSDATYARKLTNEQARVDTAWLLELRLSQLARRESKSS